jgi:hypothetical protein
MAMNIGALELPTSFCKPELVERELWRKIKDGERCFMEMLLYEINVPEMLVYASRIEPAPPLA